jgi:deazaflavin-dependent oxidoreductase (nitroreductase family)
MLPHAPYDARMPLPRWLGRLNLVTANRVTAPFAAWLPWFGVIEHVGRRSGTVRRTPLSAFRRGDRYVFALFYGPDVNWVRNVIAAGGCRLQTRGRWVQLTNPRRFSDPRRRAVPFPVRLALAVVRVDEFLELRALSAPQRDS